MHIVSGYNRATAFLATTCMVPRRIEFFEDSQSKVTHFVWA